MNKKIRVILIVIFFFLLFCMFPSKCKAADLDQILDYTTTISPRDDGTLDIKYHIEWKVLDSTTEGPLEWVKIGIPNQHVNNIKKISNNISTVKYLSSNGNYVKVKFKNKYYAGDTVIFEFSIHQSYMYNINNSTGEVSYEFTPGWFEDIKVEKATIQWKNNDILKHNGKDNGEYITWSKKLGKGQKITAKVKYSVGRFKLNYNKQNNNMGEISKLIKRIANYIMIFAFIVCIIYSMISPSYYRHGGYGYYEDYYPYRHHYYYDHHYGGHHGGGGFGGGSSSDRRRWKFILRVCMCMCRRRACWMC